MQNDCQGRDLLRLDIPIHQKTLAIFAHVIAEDIRRRNRGPTVKLEQRYRSARRETGCTIHRNGGHHACWSEIVDFLSISAPTWLAAATARDLPLSDGSGEGGHINLPVPGFVGRIGYPFSIGRNLAVNLAPWTWLKG